MSDLYGHHGVPDVRYLWRAKRRNAGCLVLAAMILVALFALASLLG